MIFFEKEKYKQERYRITIEQVKPYWEDRKSFYNPDVVRFLEDVGVWVQRSNYEVRLKTSSSAIYARFTRNGNIISIDCQDRRCLFDRLLEPLSNRYSIKEKGLIEDTRCMFDRLVDPLNKTDIEIKY